MDTEFLTNMMKTHVKLMQKQLEDGFGLITNKMKNLENFGVQELNQEELKELNGGGWLGYALGVIVGGIIKAGEGLEASGFNHQGANK